MDYLPNQTQFDFEGKMSKSSYGKHGGADRKSPAMEKVCESFAQSLFGRSRQDNVCVSCGSDKIKPEDFTDRLSLKEFGISHLCQKCQDSVFNRA